MAIVEKDEGKLEIELRERDREASIKNIKEQMGNLKIKGKLSNLKKGYTLL